MAFEVIVVLAGLVVGWTRKGNLWNIANLRLRYWWVFPVPYILQHVSVFYLNGGLYKGVIIASYVLLIAFCIANVRVPGVLWALGGTVANFIAMAANGLRMPAYIPAVREMAPQILPSLEAGTYGKSIAMSSSTHLNFLGDIFGFNVWPVSLLSVGDILFSIGLVILIQAAMRLRSEGLTYGATKLPS